MWAGLSEWTLVILKCMFLTKVLDIPCGGGGTRRRSKSPPVNSTDVLLWGWQLSFFCRVLLLSAWSLAVKV